ncbi:MAG TPA: HEAT repeat domain-containing protein [Allosphingosinicella sp.]|nr:HEAT repeat domain-containing protein [Allosphingosinicella sp.]
MIASAALAAWLADRNRQYQSHVAIEALARDWSRHRLVTGLMRRLSQLPDRSDGAIIEAARGFFDDEDGIAELVGSLIAASRRDLFFRPPFQPMISEIHSGLLLFHNPFLSIALGVSGIETLAAKKTASRGGSVIFTGVTSLYRYLKAGGATLSFWEAPPITDDFVAAQAGQCRLVERRRIEDGEEVLVDGRYQSLIVDHASSDIVYLQATIRCGAAPLSVEYDSDTLSFIGASSTDEASSRLQMMVSMLRTMERHDALPLIQEALNSPHFYVRWHIMREMLAMDADAALPALRRMAEKDPHPEVRAAARQTMDMFFEEEETATKGGVQCRA